MRLFLLIFLLACFIQTTSLPINLALILIIVRSLVIEDKHNYTIAFLGGITLGILSTQNIGIWALLFLIITKVNSLIKKLPISAKFVILMPSALIFITVINFIEQIIFKQNISTSKIIIESLLTIPVYFTMRFLDESFNAKSDIKLKLTS